MKNLINKATSFVSGAFLFAFGVVMAALMMENQHLICLPLGSDR
jgi:hypothetical protein